MKNVKFHLRRNVDTSNIIALLKACAKQKDLSKGSDVHAYIQEHSLLEDDCYIANSLVNMYARCGALAKAKEVLNKLPVWDVVTWNTLIAGYARQGQGEEALKCFYRMQHEGHSPDAVTFNCALKACGSIGAITEGEKLHEKIVKLGMLESNAFLGSTLVDMYAKSGALLKAQLVLAELHTRDTFAWTALITGYMQHGQGQEALECFDSMQHEGHLPDAVTFTCALKACGSLGAVLRGEKIHEKIATMGILQKSLMVGCTLVDMYARCGALAKAKQVLLDLTTRDVVTWNALIAGYVQHGQGEEAVESLESMEREGHSPDAVTFISALKACGCLGAAAKGEKIHEKILNLGMLEKNVLLGTALVDMYARCGELGKAQQVLEELPTRNVVTWNALIGGCAQQGQGEAALKFFDSMKSEGQSPDAVTFICALKACGSIGAAVRGKQIHDMIVSLRMLEKSVVLGNALVDMYARCGDFSMAQQVLKELPARTVVTWNALISRYVQQGQGEKALSCFDSMQCEGHSPDAVTFTCALKACGSICAADKGEKIHEKIVSLDMLEKNVALGSTLVDMYARCGVLSKARQVLEELPIRDVVTWNTLITAYTQQGEGEEALKCFDSMQQEGHLPDAVTFICALKACGITRVAGKGEEIHGKIVHLGMLEKDVALGSALMDMYVKCDALVKAENVLEDLPVRDMVTWNVLIAGYAQQEQGEEALKCFDSMQHEGHSPDVVTFTCALKACGDIGAVAKGEKIHEKVVSLDMVGKSSELGSALVDMYANCGALAKAQQVFKELPFHDVAMWTALIAGYAQQGQGDEALKCFDIMQRDGHIPDAGMFTCVLKACGSIGAFAKGEQLHDKIVHLDMLEKNFVLGSALVDMYVKCGGIAKAKQVLEGLPVRDVVSWTALIAGYVEQGQGEEAMECFDRMQRDGHFPNAVTFTYALKACGSIGAAVKGEQIHENAVTMGILEKSVMLGTALVDMYAKCGALMKAHKVFQEIPVQNVVVWNMLIGGWAMQGESAEAFNLFESMQSKGVKPNSTTLIYLLNACSHSGLLDQAEMFFFRMIMGFDVTPDLEHYCCMVDLFGRAGRLKKALKLIEKMPFAECLQLWLALLGACRKWGNVRIGKFVFECALHLDKSDSALYVCMANIYTAAGMQEDADTIEAISNTEHENMKSAWCLLD